MSPFLVKMPSIVARVLDDDLCPPHNIVHDIGPYPAYYDPLYFPHLHASIYATAYSFCRWLHNSLRMHCAACLRCVSIDAAVTNVLFDGVFLCVVVDGVHKMFERAHFESQFYIPCSVFRQFNPNHGDVVPTAGSLAHLTQHKDPFWFHYAESCYVENLQCLPSSVLTSSAQLFVRRRDDARTKNNAISIILAHFFNQRMEFSQMSADELFAALFDVSLPEGSIRT
jgi:hypothetical protein